MKLNDLNTKKIITLIIIAAGSFWIVNNVNVIFAILRKIYKVFFPFLLGGLLAFILNIPSRKIEDKLVNNFECSKTSARTISIITSLLMLIAIITFVLLLLVPELIENIQLLINNIPPLIDNTEVFILDLLDKYPGLQYEIEKVFNESLNMGDIVSNSLNYIVNTSIILINNLINGFITIFTAIVFAIYMLSQKEYLIRTFKKLISAFFSKKTVDKTLEIGELSNNIFSKFISGQCVEAVILGTIIFVASVICKFPYALIIAVLTTITALIPIFGAIIAMVVGALLIGITNPLQALIFIAVYQIIQQIETNFIYPKVVGGSIGLSPLWTLLSITVGGSLFGLAGMILALPTASVLYIIIRDKVNEILKMKKIKI